jgi:hypothetical protein
MERAEPVGTFAVCVKLFFLGRTQTSDPDGWLWMMVVGACVVTSADNQILALQKTGNL